MRESRVRFLEHNHWLTRCRLNKIGKVEKVDNLMQGKANSKSRKIQEKNLQHRLLILRETKFKLKLKKKNKIHKRLLKKKKMRIKR
jgi:hypothetical protein